MAMEPGPRELKWHALAVHPFSSPSEVEIGRPRRERVARDAAMRPGCAARKASDIETP